jgi:branched-chain amino acid transport system ATP-binding protein
VRVIVQDGTAVLLAEQNVRKALACCSRAYVLETGKVVLSGATSTLRNTEEIRKAFLGA